MSSPFSYFRSSNVTSAGIYKVIRYVIAGSTAASVNIFILFILVHFFSVHYLFASVCAVLSSMAFGFILQKYWTFRNHESNALHVQAVGYFIIGGLNLVINTSLMYLFVTVFGIWYLAGQVLAGVVIAITGFLGYQKFVFTPVSAPQRQGSFPAEAGS